MIRSGFTGPDGKEPEEVAEMVVDAIKNDRFWVITHNDLQPTIEARFAEIIDAIPKELAASGARPPTRNCKCKPKSSSASLAEMPWGLLPGRARTVWLVGEASDRRVSTTTKPGDCPDEQPAGLDGGILGESGSFQRLDERLWTPRRRPSGARR